MIRDGGIRGRRGIRGLCGILILGILGCRIRAGDCDWTFIGRRTLFAATPDGPGRSRACSKLCWRRGGIGRTGLMGQVRGGGGSGGGSGS